MGKNFRKSSRGDGSPGNWTVCPGTGGELTLGGCTSSD